MNQFFTPPPLKKGQRIGVMSPSGHVDIDKIATARDYLNAQGYEIYLHPQYSARHHQFAGTAQEKIDAFHDLIADPSIKAIIMAEGGNRSMTMLDGLDYDLIRDNPKPIMGFSDVTALLNTITARTGMVTYHGPVLSRMVEGYEGLEQTLALLNGSKPEYPAGQCRIVRKGDCHGILSGGNLSLFHMLNDTVPHNALLFMEEISEELSHVDRMLINMKRKGMFARASGLICGAFTNMTDTGPRAFTNTLEEILLEHTADYNFPIVMDAPFGHEHQNYALPIGMECSLKASGKKAEIKLA
jgi:muramoyltetrapeptide carboxypeptidase